MESELARLISPIPGRAHAAMPSKPEHNPAKPGPEGAPTLSWSILLARWTRFAQAALALPEDASGDAWRASVESIIALQAVTFALGDLHLLPVDERALSVDRAGVLIVKHERALTRAWHNQAPPPSVRELIDDARRALGAARHALSAR